MRIWKAGEAVKIKCEGRTVEGTVGLASPNGKALTLEFEAVLDGHVGMMPVIWDESACAFLSVKAGVAVELGE